MRRTPRIVLMGVAGLALLAGIGIGVLAAVVDPNDFKPKIEKAVLEATGKTLTIQGDLSLSLFPSLSLEAGPAELRDNADSAVPVVAGIEKISASVALLPLLNGRAEVTSLTVSGLRLNLAVDANGVSNWALPDKTQSGNASRTPSSSSPAPGTAQAKGGGIPAMALDSFEAEDIVIRYTDERTQSSLECSISKMELDSLRVGEKTTLLLEAAYAGSTAKPISLTLTADFTLPSSLAQGVVFNAFGKVDETSFTAKGTASLPETLEKQLFSLKGDLDFGTLNIDAYSAFSTAQKTDAVQTAPDSAPKEGQPESRRLEKQAQNLLQTLYLDLHITAKSVTVARIPLTDIKATIKADRGQLTVKPITLNAAGAPMSVEASVDAREESVRSRFIGEWRKVDIEALLRTVSGKASLTGALDLAWVLNMTGLNWSATAQTLDGKISAALENGTVPGFQLIPAGIPGLPAKTLDLSDVHGSGTWNITRGIALNNDFRVKATGLSASGKGRINIPAQTCHYNVSIDIPTIPELPDLTVLPVEVSGPLASPSYSIDRPVLLRDTARSLLNPAAKTGQELQKAGERLGKLLSR